jgi:transposase InsO family protein
MDNDEIRKPGCGNCTIFTVENMGYTLDQVILNFPHVFADGPGCMAGEHVIKVDPKVQPVQHAPRRVPVALRDKLKMELEDLVKKNIICPVTEPTKWVNSLVVVLKKNGTLRLCLDPKDLNRAIQRELYPLPTIEDVATRLHGAKVFTILDARSGFNHLMLEKESSMLTTFNSPFGRYRWKRMPFGICSAPEIFQRRMHELIEGLSGVEVIADDFVIPGYGATKTEAIRNHDENLINFLKRCAEKNVHLNSEKIQWRKERVPFIGHLATSEGLCADPAKVDAIKRMDIPTDVPAVQRFLGMIQYLAKFLPHLSDIAKPIRDLTNKETIWIWDTPQIEAWDKLKIAVASTPVLRYYELQKEVTLQCDASQSGLGVCMMQEGQPVAFASRALTTTETRYAQIEKELLAIVFACIHFHAYLYGRDTVTVETDHKPLESIVGKPLHMAPQRLQRMLLKLQDYSLQIIYKKGTLMYLADTLSRAYPQTDSDNSVHNCEVLTAEYESIDHRQSLPVSKFRWQQLSEASAKDTIFEKLRHTIRCGWPEKKVELSAELHPYYDFRDQLTVQGDLVFRGQQLVVPSCLRKELMELTHSSHIGVEGCIRRAKECLFWPRMTSELKEFVSKCDVCMAHRNNPSKEPILQHEIIMRPWAKVAADVCEIDGRTLLIVSDYYSNFLEVCRLTSLSSMVLIRALKEIFARFGAPDILVSDNGTNFASAEFADFAKSWNFEHITSSPRYAQSNGKAENTVRTVERLFRKCRDSGESEFVALLDWRNTPSEGIGTSPSQRFFGRRCKTLIPTASSLLLPGYNTEFDDQAIRARKTKQSEYYNRSSRHLPKVIPNDAVRIKLPGDKVWSPGVCESIAGPRSFNVRVGETTYRRNRRHMWKTNEEPSEFLENNVDTDASIDEPFISDTKSTVTDMAGQKNPEAIVTDVMEKSNESISPTVDHNNPRRSNRVRKQTQFFVSA